MNSTTLANTRGHGILCLAILTLLGFSLGCSEFSVIGIEAELAQEFDVSLSAVGQLVSLFALPYAIMTPLLTLMTGRFKRYTLLVTYAAVFCAANLLMALATSFEVLLASRILLGCVSGTLLAVGITYIPEIADYKKTSFYISVVYAAFSMAMVVATSLGKIAASTVGWHWVMTSVLVLALVTCVLLLIIMPKSGSTDEAATAKEQAKLLVEPSILLGMLIFVFGVGAVYVMYGYITPYLQQVLGMNDFQASSTLMAFGIICFASNLLGGVVDAKFGMRALLVLFPALAAALGGLMLSGSNVAPALACLSAVALLMYAFSVSCISVFMKIARDKHPKALTLASSLEPFSFNMGMSFGAALGGLIVAGPGLAFVGGVGAVLALAAGAVTFATIVAAKRALR